MVRRWVAAAAVATLGGCVPETPAVPTIPSPAAASTSAPKSDLLPIAHQSDAVLAFTQLLDKRVAASKYRQQVDPAEIAKIDDAVRVRFEKPLAVMITDMSGMTELTKQRGIIGVLALIREMQAITVPVVKKHGGTWVKMEADDLFVTHASAKQMYAASREMLDAIDANAAATGDASIKMGIGLGYGKVLDLGDDIWGDAVNMASKLGEDSAEPGEILISEEFHTQLAAEGEAAPECTMVDPSVRKAKFAYYRCSK